MGKNEDLLTGLIIGALGLLVLKEVMKPKCPVCGIEVQQGQQTCHRCGTIMRWQQ